MHNWLLSLALIPVAYADGESTACAFAGCSSENTLGGLGQAVGEILIYMGAALCVLFIVWGGFQMMTSMGDDSQINQGRMSAVYAMGGFALLLGVQTILAFVVDQSEAINPGPGGDPIIAIIGGAIDLILTVFNIVFVFVMVYAGYMLVIGRGQADQFEKSKKLFNYAAIGAITINIAKALATAILNLGI